VSPRSVLASDRFSADQLILNVSNSYDPDLVDLAAYDDFIESAVRKRGYQAQAVRTALRFLCGGRYSNSEELARETYDNSADLQRLYPSADALVERLPFPDKLSCSLDLATGTGKSFVLYLLARIMLNEGLIDRVLVLCPSVTIERGLTDKFIALLADTDQTELLPVRGGHPIPSIVDGSSTVMPGEICIENVHAAYETAGSSLEDSFSGNGQRTLVMSDEAHHVVSAGGQAVKKWHDFLSNPKFNFRYHVGVSGTCYVKNEYFSDVIYRYALRNAIEDRWVKEVYYLAEDDSTTDDERFQKLVSQHEKNRKSYAPLKPLTIAVTKDIKSAEVLAQELVSFLARTGNLSTNEAEQKVLVVTSADKHKANVLKLDTVDDAASPTEWIVSVAMLTEGWDVKNVFQIYPHQKRAFDSKLLISQVLGRGLRRPEGFDGNTHVYVFNHQRWGPQIDDFVAEILDQDTTISQRPVVRKAAGHFNLHALVTSALPQTVTVTRLEANKRLESLKLVPQMDAEEQTRFVSATDSTRAEVLTTRVVERRYPVDEVLDEVRAKLLLHDKKTAGNLAEEYTRERIRTMMLDALRAVGADPSSVSQENRQRILNSFGGLRQRTAISAARLQTAPVGLAEIRTSFMRPISERVAALAKDVTLLFDELSAELSDEADQAALAKADGMPDPKNLVEVGNSFDFKSPTNVVLVDYQPERRFVQRLVQAKHAKCLESWVKAPDTGFYEIEYAFQEGGVGRSKRGTFNPDFFLLMRDTDLVAVCEVKADGDDSWRNRGKHLAAVQHFQEVNKLLEADGNPRRYVFHMLSPRDFDKYFEALRAGTLSDFKSSLEGVLAGKQLV
jgi:type III restriction enzyme